MIPDFYGYNKRSKFVIGKRSALAPEPPGIKYFQKTRHTRNQGSLQEAFLATFNTQVYPTILPGLALSPLPAPLTSFRILTELSQSMLTEIGNYLIIE